MKTLACVAVWLFILLGVFCAAMNSQAQDKDPWTDSTFRAITLPGEEVDADKVTIEEIRPERYTWSVAEIDSYILQLRLQESAVKAKIEQLERLREILKREAEKVRLKGDGERRS